MMYGSAEPKSSRHRTYDVVALEVPIVFNASGDHDHDGRIYALAKHKDALDDIRANFPRYATTPHPLVQPLVLRACAGDTVTITFTNYLKQPVGIHLVGDGYSVVADDGRSSTASPT